MVYYLHLRPEVLPTPPQRQPATPSVLSEISAYKHLQPTGTSFDYSLPPGFDASLPIPLACTFSDALAKVSEKYGGLMILAAAGAELPHLFAAATRRNQTYVYDVNKPNEPVTWLGADAEVGAMAWNPAVLTVGGGKGRIRPYDTRITPANRMREHARRLMRHQAKVTALGYHRLGNKLATGDAAGNVFVWDFRNQDTTSMDVGEFVLRRKKNQHDAPISSISWFPFDSQIFVTGDTSGTIRRWDVTANTSFEDNFCFPKLTDNKRAVLALLYAPSGCRELLPLEDRQSLPDDARSSSLPGSSQITSQASRRHSGAPQPTLLDARDPGPIPPSQSPPPPPPPPPPSSSSSPPSPLLPPPSLPPPRP
ncbi:WD40-repeat-containing domain protein [Schizophyllum commune]